MHTILNVITSCFDNNEKKSYIGTILSDLAKTLDAVNHIILLKNLNIAVFEVLLINFLYLILPIRRSQIVLINKW